MPARYAGNLSAYPAAARYAVDGGEARRLGLVTVFLDDGVAADRPALAVPLNLPEALGLPGDGTAHVGLDGRDGRAVAGARRHELGGLRPARARRRAISSAPSTRRPLDGVAAWVVRPTHRSISTQVRALARGGTRAPTTTSRPGAAARRPPTDAVPGRASAARPGPRTRRPPPARRGVAGRDDAVGPGPAHQCARGTGGGKKDGRLGWRPRRPLGSPRGARRGASDSLRQRRSPRWSGRFEQRGLMSTPGPRVTLFRGKARA